MTKINPNKFGSSRPKLLVEDLEGNNSAVLTMHGFEEVTITNEEGTKITPCLEFEETGEKVLWLNKTQLEYIIEKYGDETDAWRGKPLPIETTTQEFRGKRYPKLWVAAPERWDEIFEAAGLTERPKRREPVKMAKAVKGATRKRRS